MKPNASPASTVVFRSRFPSAIAAATAPSPVRAPRTFSRSFMTFAGEKKCVPTTRAGSATASAIASIDSVDVFDARTVVGLQAPSSRAKRDRFASRSS